MARPRLPRLCDAREAANKPSIRQMLCELFDFDTSPYVSIAETALNTV